MIFWVIVVAVCYLLHYSPFVISNIIINLFRVMFMLVGALCTWVCHEIGAASGTAWIIFTLPDYVAARISSRASHSNTTVTPNEGSPPGDLVNNAVTPNTVTPNPVTPNPVTPNDGSPPGDLVINTVTPSENRPMNGLVQRCGGRTINDAPCKREGRVSTDQTGQWYCRDHIKKRPG